MTDGPTQPYVVADDEEKQDPTKPYVVSDDNPPYRVSDETPDHRRAVVARNTGVGVTNDRARGFATGLSDTGYNFAKGLTYLAGKLPGVNTDAAMSSLDRQEQEARDYYDADPRIGRAGYLTGRVLGEGAELMAGSEAVGAGAKALSGVSKVASGLSSAIEAGREGSFAQRLAATVIPGAPVDFVSGAGSADQGENRTVAGLKNTALALVLPTAIEGSRSVYRVGREALAAGDEIADGVMHAGAQGVAESEPGHLTTGMSPDELRAVQRGNEAARDPLSQRAAAYRNIASDDAAAEQDAVLRGRALGATGDQSVHAPGYRIDATGQIVPDVVPPTQTVAEAPPSPELVPRVPVLESKAPPPIETTQVRQLDASQGGRFVEDGKAQPFENIPGPSGANADATQKIEIASGYRTRTHAPITDEARLLSDRTGAQPSEGTAQQGPAIPLTSDSGDLSSRGVSLREPGEEAPFTVRDEVPASAPNGQAWLPSARTDGGRIRLNLENVHPHALGDELLSLDEARAADTPGYHVTAPEYQVGRPWSGVTPGGAKAIGRNAQRSVAFNRISDELEKRGVSPLEALNDAVERRRVAEQGGPTVDAATGELKNDDGFTLFSPPAVGGAAIGGATQSNRKPGESDQDFAARLMLGMAAGAAGVTVARRALPALAEATRGVRGALADAIAPEAAAERRGLDRAANTDVLTGLGNARAYQNVLNDAEQNPNVQVVRFDLNGFKGVNDAAGHAAGDVALKDVAATIRKAAPNLPAFRVGGDEFAVFASAKNAEAVRDAIEQGLGVQDAQGAKYSISGGVGDTDAAADAAAQVRKGEQKAAQGIAPRAGTATEIPGNTNDAGFHAVAPFVAAGAGGTQGDTNEDRFRNALVAAAAVAVGGVAARKAYNAFTGKVELTPMSAEAEAALGRSSIDFSGSAAKQLSNDAAGGFRAKLARTLDGLANAGGPIERLGRLAEQYGLKPTQNPGQLLAYRKSSNVTISDFYSRGIVDATTREVSGPSFTNLFDRFNSDTDAIRTAMDYVVAKRDVGRGLAGVGGNAQRLSDATALAKWGDNDPVMREFARDWQTYTDGIGKYAVDSGLWTNEQWNAIKGSDVLYVRYKRLLESPSRGNVRGQGIGGPNPSSGVQSFTGSDRMIENPAQAMAEYTAAMIRRADQQRVVSSIFDAVDKLGPEGQTVMTRVHAVPASRPAQAMMNLQTAQAAGATPDVAKAIDEVFSPITDPKNPVVWRNSAQGGREYGVVHAPDLWNALNSLQPEKDPGAIRAMLDVTLRPLRRIFTATTTGLSPRYVLMNLTRDAIDATVKTKSGITPLDMAQGLYEGVKDIFGASDVGEQMARSGVGTVAIFGSSLKPSAVARDVAPTGVLDKVASVFSAGITAPVRALERVGEASDKVNRIAEYTKALKEAQPKVDSGEWSVTDARLFAANRARRVNIDFGNKPGNQYVRALDDYLPFFGAALKGSVQMGEAIADNPLRGAVGVAGVSLAAFTAWSMQHALTDDARAKIKDRPVTERASNLLVPLDASGENLIRIPMRQEMGLIAAGVTAALDKVYENDPHAARLFGQAVVRALPPGVGEPLIDHSLTVPIPGVEQLIENARNRRDFGGAPVEAPRLQELPPEERRYDTTSPTFDAIAAGGRALGASNFSPLQAENLARGVTSSFTPIITNVTDRVAGPLMHRTAAPGAASPLARDPLNPVSGVVAPAVPPNTESEQDYYEIATRAKQYKNLLEHFMNTGDTSVVGTLRKNLPMLDENVQTVVQAVDAVSKELRDQETAIRASVETGTLSPDDGRAKLDEVKAQQQAVYRRAMHSLRSMSVPQ